MQPGWTVVFITTVVMVSHVYASNLEVSLVAKRLSFSANQVVGVTFKYINKGHKTIPLNKQYVPNQQLKDPLFQITRNGQPVKYVERLSKRVAGVDANTISLKPGEEISMDVPLSSAYDMTESGNYVVQFVADIRSMTSDPALILDTNGDPADFMLKSNQVQFFAEGRSNLVMKETAEYAKESRASTYSFYGCSSSRQSAIITSLKVANTYAASSLTYLQKLTSKSSTRYSTWFGTYSSTNLGTLRTHYTNIKTVLSSKPMSFDCSCTEPETFAYVYSDRPYKIYLCMAFWGGATTGTDSRAGTLIHETSHFTVVAGTKDNAYGQTACKALAKSNPAKAVMNADSHEYFTENTPALT